MMALPFVSSAAVGSSARITEGSPTTARAIATRCCSPPLSCADNSGSCWTGRPVQRRARFIRRVLAGLRRERRERASRCRRRRASEQVIGLEHEADVLRRKLGQVLRSLPAIESPRTRTVPSVGVSMQPRMESSCLPLRRPISNVNCPPLSARSTPFNARICPAPWPRSLRRRLLPSPDRSSRGTPWQGRCGSPHDGRNRRDDAHDDGQQKQRHGEAGRDTIGSAPLAVIRTTRRPIR